MSYPDNPPPYALEVVSEIPVCPPKYNTIVLEGANPNREPSRSTRTTTSEPSVFHIRPISHQYALYHRNQEEHKARLSCVNKLLLTVGILCCIPAVIVLLIVTSTN